MLGGLAGGVVHDFNNLLTAVGGYAGLVYHELPVADPKREDLDEVLKAVERARVLTLRLLMFARGTPARPQVVPVGEVLPDIERLLRHVIGDDIELQTSLRARGSVRLHVGALEQVLVNLALNARDAMPKGGSLLVETQDVVLEEPVADGILHAPAGGYVRLTVADTGTGMNSDTRSHVFESFFTSKAPGKGAGIGLATVYASVEQARGDITIASRPGEGTRFDLYLPRARGAEATPRVEPAVPRGTEAVLVADDEGQVRAATVRMLEALGYTVAGIASPTDALKRCMPQATRPDLLVTDMVMPTMTGPELARRCLAIAPELRVLYMSGLGTVPGVEPLLLKPFDQRALGQAVRGALDT
jgi:CheY-like chemotaxis protein